jgi:gamma-glutamyltranspeptidase/glutathione hydrolase
MGILAQGGSAADAVAAAYFTLAVTYPSAASLGGGGVCMVEDWQKGQVVSLDFVAPRSSATGARRATAVPANVRGMAALQARYGSLDWRTVVAPAEQIARFGEPLTRASASAYATGGEKLFAQYEARGIFAGQGGLPREGQVFKQSDLADMLADVRLNGGASMYDGELADKLIRAVQQAGGSLSRQDLSNFKPIWQAVPGVPYGNDRAYFSPPPAGAGLIAGQMWEMLREGDRYADANRTERYHLLAETARLAFAGRAKWLADDGTNLQPGDLLSAKAAKSNMAGYDPKAVGSSNATDGGPPDRSAAPASTGVVAMDYLGGAVACSFTAYRPFGTGMVAPGTGILLAPSPEPADRNPLSLGAAMIFNPNVRSIKFVGTGGDGADGATALASVAAATMLGEKRLDKEIGRPRVHRGGGDTLYVEKGLGDDTIAALKAMGHTIAVVPSLGRVNAIDCPPGYPVTPKKTLCWAEADPRGFGLAAFPE